MIEMCHKFRVCQRAIEEMSSRCSVLRLHFVECGFQCPQFRLVPRAGPDRILGVHDVYLQLGKTISAFKRHACRVLESFGSLISPRGISNSLSTFRKKRSWSYTTHLMVVGPAGRDDACCPSNSEDDPAQTSPTCASSLLPRLRFPQYSASSSWASIPLANPQLSTPLYNVLGAVRVR